MPSELPPEEDRPGVPIAPPLLFVLPILASLALEWLAPTSFVHGAFRWILGALIVVAGIALTVSGFITQKRAGTDPIPFNPSTRIVAHGLYRFTRNPMYIGFAFCALLGSRSWSIPRGCCSPCQSALSSSIASSSRAKNAISSASSERNISTTNAASDAWI